jgi:hypothetical protein
MRRFIAATLLSLAVGMGTASAGEVFLRVGPPRPLIERRIIAPSRAHVWLPGYYRWGGAAYAWTPGYWALPPRPRAVWVAPRWNHYRSGWVFVGGRWR